MIDLEEALGSLTTIAERYSVPVERIMSAAHRRVIRRRAWRTALAAMVAILGIAAAIAVTRSHTRASVSVQPSSGTVSRTEAVAALRTAPGSISRTATVQAKLITFDDYAYASNSGNAPAKTPTVLQPSETPITWATPIW